MGIGMAHATAPDKIPDPSPALAGVAIRYPEKTFFLGQVFNDTTNSYKLVWFLAILALIKRRDEDAFPISDILTEMAVGAGILSVFTGCHLADRTSCNTSSSSYKSSPGFLRTPPHRPFESSWTAQAQ